MFVHHLSTPFITALPTPADRSLFMTTDFFYVAMLLRRSWPAPPAVRHLKNKILETGNNCL
jgi:hypothetical protein